MHSCSSDVTLTSWSLTRVDVTEPVEFRVHSGHAWVPDLSLSGKTHRFCPRGKNKQSKPKQEMLLICYPFKQLLLSPEGYSWGFRQSHLFRLKSLCACSVWRSQTQEWDQNERWAPNLLAHTRHWCYVCCKFIIYLKNKVFWFITRCSETSFSGPAEVYASRCSLNCALAKRGRTGWSWRSLLSSYLWFIWFYECSLYVQTARIVPLKIRYFESWPRNL